MRVLAFRKRLFRDNEKRRLRQGFMVVNLVVTDLDMSFSALKGFPEVLCK